MVDKRALKKTIKDIGKKVGEGKDAIVKDVVKSAEKVRDVVKSDAFKDTVKDVPRVAKEQAGKVKDKVKKVAKSDAFKDTVKDIPRVAKEQAEKVKKVFSKKDKPSTADRKHRRSINKGRKYNPNKVIMAKEGGMIKKCKIDGITKKVFTRANSPKKGK